MDEPYYYDSFNFVEVMIVAGDVSVMLPREAVYLCPEEALNLAKALNKAAAHLLVSKRDKNDGDHQSEGHVAADL